MAKSQWVKLCLAETFSNVSVHMKTIAWIQEITHCGKEMDFTVLTLWPQVKLESALKHKCQFVAAEACEHLLSD